LAVVGGITGAGLGYGLPVAWLTIGFVLALGAIAPAVGATGAFALSRAARRLGMTGVANRRIRLLHRFAFGMQCVAYGANDGQKMLAVFAVASGTARAPLTATAPQLAAIGGLFMLGTVIGLRQFAGTIGGGVLPLRPPNAVAAELAAAISVLFSAGLGAPVSMTQTTAGALVGTGVSEGYKRVRWRAAFHIVLAWVFTLPMSAALAATLAYVEATVR
jgi:PiT family inorganic phosphate transporter